MTRQFMDSTSHDAPSSSTRELVPVGADEPTDPFPIFLRGKVIRGFGRGSKELGIPTANLSEDAVATLGSTLATGIYYGWARIDPRETGAEEPSEAEDPLWSQVYPMVMSLGWNPYYKNEKRSAEVHLIQTFPRDFYNQTLRVLVLGYIRPEQNYTSVDDLIRDIHMDIQVARISLKREAFAELREDSRFVVE